MLMKDFRDLISPNAILEIRSYHTKETIKKCRAYELTEEDLNLLLQGIHATINVNASTNFFNTNQKEPLGIFILWVTEN